MLPPEAHEFIRPVRPPPLAQAQAGHIHAPPAPGRSAGAGQVRSGGGGMTCEPDPPRSDAWWEGYRLGEAHRATGAMALHLRRQPAGAGQGRWLRGGPGPGASG